MKLILYIFISYCDSLGFNIPLGWFIMNKRDEQPAMVAERFSVHQIQEDIH